MKHKIWCVLLVMVCGSFNSSRLDGARVADADVAVAAKTSGVKATRAEQRAARLAAANAAIDASSARATVARRGVGTTARVEPLVATKSVAKFNDRDAAQGVPADLQDVPEVDKVGDDEGPRTIGSARFAAASPRAAATGEQLAEIVLTQEQTAGLQALHQALTAQEIENIGPALHSVFAVDQLDGFVTKLLAAKRFTDADLDQLNKIFHVGSTVNIARRLAGIEVTPELKEQLTSFLNKLKPLLKLALPEDSATEKAMQTIVKSMKGADHTNLASMSLTSVLDSLSGAVRSSGAKLQKQTSSRNMKIFVGLLATNLAMVMFTIFGTSDMKKIGSGLLIAEAVMLSMLLLGRGGHSVSSGGIPFNMGGAGL